MTNMALTQASEAPWSVDLDPIDLLVPPPRGFRRSLVLTGIAVLVLFVIALTGSSGLLRPKLGLALDASYTAAGPTSRPSLTFNVQNNGHFRLSIVGVDARAAGLSDVRVSVALFGAEGQLVPSHGVPLTIQGGREAHITMTFAKWNCQKIEPHGNNSVPIHLSNPLGLNATVSVLPGFHFDPPSAGVLIGSPDPNEIGWAAGITWTSCHTGSGPPNMGSPSQ
jgi:hypothetical protein